MASQRLSFVSKIGVILKATSDDENPTAGYLYKEINDISFESVGYCVSLVDFLVDRLKSNSCHVKFKVLKLMKHLSENGSSEFQLGLRKHSDAIKECIKFGGPPHPMHGNIPYLMVRKISKELCEVLYNMEQLSDWQQTGDNMPDRTLQSKYGGLGPVGTGGSNLGFGNTPTQPKTFGETIMDGIEKLGAKMSEKPSDRQAALLAKLDLGSSNINYKPPAVILGNEELTFASPVLQTSHGTSLNSMQKPVKKHQPGKAGGGWGDDDDDEADNNDEDNENNNDNGSKQLSIETDSLADQAKRSQGEELQADWKEEYDLVAAVLNQGSTGRNNAFLTSSAISEFLIKCCTLNCDKVVEMLAQNLIGQDAGVILKSLQLLEGIIYNREEIVSIDRLALMCKESIVRCYLDSVSQHQASSTSPVSAQTYLSLHKELKTDQESGDNQLWLSSAVKVKSAKVILILQQLSSHKEILAPSHFKNYLNIDSPVSDFSSDLVEA